MRQMERMWASGLPGGHPGGWTECGLAGRTPAWPTSPPRPTQPPEPPAINHQHIHIFTRPTAVTALAANIVENEEQINTMH
eukprot:scaffold148229_cov46-Prasinocladus_malaysianus.AAC.2